MKFSNTIIGTTLAVASVSTVSSVSSQTIPWDVAKAQNFMEAYDMYANGNLAHGTNWRGVDVPGYHVCGMNARLGTGQDGFHAVHGLNFKYCSFESWNETQLTALIQDAPSSSTFYDLTHAVPDLGFSMCPEKTFVVNVQYQTYHYNPNGYNYVWGLKLVCNDWTMSATNEKIIDVFDWNDFIASGEKGGKFPINKEIIDSSGSLSSWETLNDPSADIDLEDATRPLFMTKGAWYTQFGLNDGPLMNFHFRFASPFYSDTGISGQQYHASWVLITSGYNVDLTLTSTVETTEQHTVTNTQKASIEMQMQSGINFGVESDQITLTGTYSNSITTSMQSTFDQTESDTIKVTCPSSISTGSAAVYQWIVSNEMPNEASPGVKVQSRNYQCTTAASYKPCCPLTFCDLEKDQNCQICISPFEALSHCSPTSTPTAAPTVRTAFPTSSPTVSPTIPVTAAPTPSPTDQKTDTPVTLSPTTSPTSSKVTDAPTNAPTPDSSESKICGGKTGCCSWQQCTNAHALDGTNWCSESEDQCTSSQCGGMWCTDEDHNDSNRRMTKMLRGGDRRLAATA